MTSVQGQHDYDLRSLQHERRMMAEYRRAATHDASLLEPLANACRRAAAFEWKLYGDAETVRRLWGESARALAQGFARRRAGFDPSPEQFVLALHLAIAARERDAFTTLALSAPPLRGGALRGARAFSDSRAHFHLAEGYALVAHALVEQAPQAAAAATESLAAARAESDAGWWQKQFPDALDAAWRISEHDAVCMLLGFVARCVADSLRPEDSAGRPERAARAAEEFAQGVDQTLLLLEHFIETDANHHPKLYVWLPGIALGALAASAGLPMDWPHERHEAKTPGYERLPLALLRHPPSPS